jgi:hypothetical protein
MDPELMRLAAVLLVGAIAALLDTTIVNVARGDPGRALLPGDGLVVGGVHRPGGAACGYAAGPPRSGPGAGPRRPGGRSASRVTVSRRGDGTATGQLASAQTVRPG